MIIDKSLTKRFWKYTEKLDKKNCWKWTGAKLKDGYGQIGETKTGKTYQAHRVSWAIHNKKDPGRAIIRHKCDNPECVNPHHLLAGTHKDNRMDAVRRNRVFRPIGDLSQSARLNWEQVGLIRKRYEAGESQSSIARSYQVSISTIHNVVHFKTWQLNKEI